MTYQRPCRTRVAVRASLPGEPTGSDWPILLLVVALGLMLWFPVVILVIQGR